MGSLPQGEQQASHELAMLRAALDAHAIVAITDRQGLIQYVNDKFCEISGFSRQELLGSPHSIVNSGHHDRAFFRDLWSTIAQGRIWRGEIRNRARDGRVYWVDTAIVPICNAGGQPYRYVSLRYDITARKMAEQAEREHEEMRYRTLYQTMRAVWDGVPHCVGITDAHGFVLDINPAGVALLGASGRDALIGRRLTGFVHPEDLEAAVRSHAQAVAGHPGSAQYRLIDGAGTVRRVRQRCVPLRDEAGVGTVVCVLEDVTRDLESRAALEQARSAAEAGERAKAQFLANMSHEIRTPLNAVIGLSELLLGSPLEDGQRKFVHTIHRSGRALLELVSDVLDLSKIEAGRVDIEHTEFDLSGCLQDALEIVMPSASAKGLALLLEGGEDLPPRVRGDPSRLRQVLLNLLSNAVKFTAHGEVRVLARARCSGPQDLELAIEVRDTGIGIPADRMDRLFQVFSQVDASTSRRFGGTGLGLAISHRLVALMGGTLGVRSVPGEGSTFSFAVPLALAGPWRRAPAAPAARDHGGVPAPAPAAPAQRRVLLVEDNEVNQMVAQHMLAELGCSVRIAADGEEAIGTVREAQAAGEPFDIVFMDIQMPVLNGIEATRAIRADPPAGLPAPWIVAMTANAMEGDRDACMAAGMNDYVSKPITLEALSGALARAPQAQAFQAA